ncbi:MAG TPA: T9SS type A sorting domain-containing protein [Phnomibacter sp.]|nr:T9SS type A sorting domain-containing protein [Phnomibacter sp.]
MQTIDACVAVLYTKRPINTCLYGLSRRIALCATVGCFLLCLLAVSAQAQITSDVKNRGLEDGGNGSGFWNAVAGAVSVDFANTAQKRTGNYSLMHRVTNSTKQKIEWLNNQVSVPNNSYVHIIYYARANNSNIRTYPGITFLPDASHSNAGNVTPSTSNFNTRVTLSRQNLTGSTQNAYGFVETNRSSSNGDIDAYYDDFVIYTSTNSTTDVTKPNAPTCLKTDSYSSTAITLNWAIGSDANSGLQGTLIFRSVTTGNSPSLNDQATYTTSAIPSDGVNIVAGGGSTTWTLIDDVPASQTTYTDATVVAGTGYRYAIVHYDLALNYSSPVTLNVRAGAPDISQSIQNISKPSGGTFTPGNQIRINVSVAAANAIYLHNVVARINIPSGLDYVAGSMKILDNKGGSYSSASAASGLPCSGSYTEPGSSSSLTDAGSDDRGRVVSGYVEIMLGELPTPTNYSNLQNNVGNQSGGRIVGGLTKPRFYSSQTIIVASIDVTIPAGTPIGTVFPITSAVSYSLTETSTLAAKTTFAIESMINPDRYIEVVVSDPNLPSSYSARGANLFTLYNSGTFGSGTDISGPDPASSPNFAKNIISSGTPNDGAFAVVKNTAADQIYYRNDSVFTGNAARVFGVWSILGDHTGASVAADGNVAVHRDNEGGYALAVNADYVPKRVVSQTLTGLCPGTFYNFKAWFRNICPACGANSDDGNGLSTASSDPRRQGVKPNLTFDINNQAYYTTGQIDTADKWIQKEFVFATGATSGDFNFSIRNNANGGDGNDWMIDDISIVTRGPIASVAVDANPLTELTNGTYCVGQRFQVIGNWLESTTGFSQYDTYQFQYAYTTTGPWNAMAPAKEIPSPNDPYNPTSGRVDTVISPQFVDQSKDVYFRMVVATQTANISLADAAPCQIPAFNASVVKIGTCILPIKLLRFKAASVGQKVFLNWAAGDIDRLQYFVIERSTNGVDFESVKQVDPKAFETPFQYQLTDMPNAMADRLWYRLKMVHLNNEIKYSNIEVVSWKKQSLSLSIQPNPAREFIQLNWSGVTPGQRVKLTISNTSGHLLYTEIVSIQQGPTQRLRLPDIPSGFYLLQVEDEKTSYRQALKLQKL